MKRFAALIKALDETNKTNKKVKALSEYFEQAPDKDKVWTIALLSHRRPARPVNTTLLRNWAAEWADIPLWLFEESYHIVGDLAETIALVVASNQRSSRQSLAGVLRDLLDLKSKDDESKKAYMRSQWGKMDYYQCFVFNKLFTGGFRIGVSQKLMTKALGQATGIDEDLLAYRIMGNWDPATIEFKDLILQERAADKLSKPYPFYLAYALEGDVTDLGMASDWSVEHKWDGIRGQVIVREGQVFVWTRGEELVTEKYPEFQVLCNLPSGTVIDGEILPFIEGKIGTFNDLQTRIGRKSPSKKMLAQTPVILKAYDLLEWQGKDIRHYSFKKRRTILDKLVVEAQLTALHISPTHSFQQWSEVSKERDKAREQLSEGLMLKNLASKYLVGRKKGDWWKWKVDPLTIDAVLTYAMRGHGRRSNLFTDYTFGLWQEEQDGTRVLVTFAKAYSGLTDQEFRQVDRFIKQNTIERFGPVRSVTPQLVFEIAFEGVAFSKRHKSGVATRFPRIVRWRKDKSIQEANSLDDLKKMIP